jgi:hypothetical protein
MDTTTCPICGFNQLGKEFLNRDDAEQWEKEILIPYRTMWLSKDKDFKIDGTTLLKYIGKEKSVRIPDFITTIGESAFSRNLYVEEVFLPKSLVIIDKWAFGNCENLREILIPDSVEVLEENAFYGCENLKNVHIGEGVIKIGKNAFSKCSNLMHIYIGQSVQEFAADKFESPFDDSGELEFDVNTKNEYYYVDNHCLIKSSRRNFLIKGNSKSVIPDYIEIIGPFAFAHSNVSKSITIPKGITEIQDAAFYESGIESVLLPDGLKIIRNAAFGLCNIPRVVIPASVSAMGEVPFEKQYIEIYLYCSKFDIESRINKTNESLNLCHTEDD